MPPPQPANKTLLNCKLAPRSTLHMSTNTHDQTGTEGWLMPSYSPNQLEASQVCRHWFGYYPVSEAATLITYSPLLPLMIHNIHSDCTHI